MSWFTILSIACTLACNQIPKGLKFLKGITGRDLAPGASNERFSIFYSDEPTTRDFTGVSIETNGIVSNTTALFKFPDGTDEVGTLTGHGAHFPNGIGYGNFSVDGAAGQWITVDFSEGPKDVAQFFEWLVVATQDGNVTAEEFKQAVDIIERKGAIP